MQEQMIFLHIEESRKFLINQQASRIYPSNYCNKKDNPLIQSLLSYYNQPKLVPPLPFEIESLIDISEHLIESQMVYEKQESSNILDDQEQTQVPSQNNNLLEQISEKSVQCNHLIRDCLKFSNTHIFTKELNLISRLFEKIHGTLQQISGDSKQENHSPQKQQRFFSQHNSDQEGDPQQTKVQFIYNPDVLTNMLKRLKQNRKQPKLGDKHSRSIFRGNQRLIQQQGYKLSLQNIPLIESKSPIIRHLQNPQTMQTCNRETNSIDKQIQRTELNEQLSQGALNFLKQLKKTRSIELRNRKLTQNKCN